MSDISIPTHPSFKNLTGKTYGRLTAVNIAGNSRSGYTWRCACECGNEAVVRGSRLTAGDTQSCGCLHTDRITTHGMTNTTEYSSWICMKQRCTDPNASRYKDWGGRGITVCDRWLNSFPAFLSDMGRKPKGMSLDRIDNDKGYSKENCKWSTSSEQNRNKRKQRNQTGTTGVYFSKSGTYVAQIRSGKKLFYLGTYPTIELAAAARKAGEVKYWGH